jgi:hypothetical protein
VDRLALGDFHAASSKALPHGHDSLVVTNRLDHGDGQRATPVW